MNKQILFMFCAMLLASILFAQSEDQEVQGGVPAPERVASVIDFNRGKGPSGDPKLNFDQSKLRKEAQNKALKADNGNNHVEHNALEPGQRDHFHPANKDESKKEDGSHYNGTNAEKQYDININVNINSNNNNKANNANNKAGTDANKVNNAHNQGPNAHNNGPSGNNKGGNKGGSGNHGNGGNKGSGGKKG